MLNPREAFGLIAAAATSLTLAACGANIQEPELPSSLFAQLSAKPIESYTLIPYVKRLDDRSEVMKNHKLIIKIGERVEHKALNDQGKLGTNFCSAFQIADTVIDDKGKLNAIYQTASAAKCLVPVDFIDNSSVSQLASHIAVSSSCITKDKTAELVAAITTHCAFRPSAL